MKWKSYFSSFTAIALLSVFAPTVTVGQEVQQLSPFEQSGVKNLPASVLAIIGREGSGYTGHATNQSSYTDESNIARMLDGIEVASSRYAKEKQGLDVIRANHDNLQLGLRLSSIVLANPAASVAIEIGSKALSDRVNSVIAETSAYYSEQYQMSLQNVVNLAVARTDAEIQKKWEGQLTEGNVGAAMSEIFGPQVDFFNRFALTDLSPEAKAEITNAKADMLAKALARQKLMSDSERKADREALEQGMDAQATKIKKIATEVSVFRKEWQSQLTALQDTQRAAYAGLKAELVDVKGDIDAIQKQMWRGMGPRERLAALNDGFLRTMKPEDRAQTIADLKVAVGVMDKRDEVLQVLGYAGQLGNVLAQVGFPIDVENFQKNINTASTVVNVVSNLALNNWLGAAQAAAGLFGGGGRDVDAERHQEIMQALGETIRLQQETLKQIEQLSKQITASTNLVLSTLDKMDRKLDTILNLQVHMVFADGGACGEFIRRAKSEGMSGGVFSSYEARRTHFRNDIESGYDHYFRCKRFINTYKDVNQPDSFGNGGFVVPLVFREEVLASSQADRLAPLLRRMLSLTLQASGNLGDARCTDRMLAYLSDAPRTFSVAKLGDIQCSSTSNAERKLKSHNGLTINGASVLSDAVAAGSVRTVVNYALFLAPYNTLLAPDAKRLLTLDELRERQGQPIRPNDDAILWPKHYQDLISIALAQQTVLSGVYALPLAREIAEDTQFGRRGYGTWLAPEKVTENHRCQRTDTDSILEKDDYQSLACLFGENPWFLSNFTRYVVTENLRSSGVTLNDYNFALSSSDGSHIREMLPNIRITWKQPEGDIKSPWMVDMRDAAGRVWLVPLPTASEIRSNIVAYRPVADELFKLRKALQDRIILQDESVQSLAGENDAGFLFRRAVMSSPSLLAVNVD